MKSAALTVCILASFVGCGGDEVQPAVPAAAAPAPMVVVDRTQPPPPPRLVGLPLTGAQIQVLGDIEFDTGSANIRQTPQTQGILNMLANAGRAYDAITKLRVEGHTDNAGGQASNQALSERRAEAVVKWLVDHGIAPGRLASVGCGERVPLVPNDSPENMQKNRRIEFHITEVDGRPYAVASAICTPNPYLKKGAGSGVVIPREDVKWEYPASRWVAANVPPRTLFQMECPRAPAFNGVTDRKGYGGRDLLYTLDTSPCWAALHAGKITVDGGTVFFEYRGSGQGYYGVAAYNVTMGDWPGAANGFQIRK